jgi:hypothetical protein
MRSHTRDETREREREGESGGRMYDTNKGGEIDSDSGESERWERV